MRYVSINEAESGMILATAVFDQSGIILLGAMNVLNAKYIQKLRKIGIPGVYITDEFSKDIVIEDTISTELRNRGVESLRQCNMDACLKISRIMTRTIMENKNISLDMVDLRTYDDYTFRHSVNVAVIATVIGEGLGLNYDELVQLCMAGLFHDIGKIKIDTQIFNKPALLTDSEYEIMKGHSRLSYEFLKDKWDVTSLTKIAVLQHHENEDGSGYPQGLSGEEIHQFSKIIHVADVYDALISKRPYKEPYSTSEAVEYLMGGCGIQFDRKIVETFLQYVPVYPIGVKVILSDGREGIVVKNKKGFPLRPVIRLFSGKEINLSDLSANRDITASLSRGKEIDYVGELNRRQRNSKKNKVIMIVDDDIVSLRTTSMLIEDEYKLVLLKSGDQAINYLQEEKKPDLILMDYEMPGLDGIQVSRQIRAKNKETPILFLTAHSEKSIVMMCQSVGVNGYLVKPCTKTYLKERIKCAFKEHTEY